MNHCAERCNCVEGDPAIASPGYLARRRHDNAGDLDAIGRILGWLREGKHVCHIRFGDGEFHGIMGKGDCYGSHPRIPELGEETEQTLLDMACLAQQINATESNRLLVGGEWEYDSLVWNLIECLDIQDRIPWCPSQIFVQGIYNGASLEMLKLIRDHPGTKYLVANSRICHAACGPLRAVPMEIRYNGSYLDMPRVYDTLDRELQEGDIVLWCASVGCKPTLWKTYMNHPWTTHLDLGHFFDGAVGDRSRTWLNVENQRRTIYFDTIVPWLRGVDK